MKGRKSNTENKQNQHSNLHACDCVCVLLCITCSGCEIQLVFGSEHDALGADLQYGRRLNGADQSKQGQLRRDGFAIHCFLILTIQELQPPLKVYSL